MNINENTPVCNQVELLVSYVVNLNECLPSVKVKAIDKIASTDISIQTMLCKLYDIDLTCMN